LVQTRGAGTIRHQEVEMASKKNPGGGRPKDDPVPPAPPPTPPGPALNRLIIGSNGVWVQSGATGEIRQLTPEEAAAVMPLLLQRQQLGAELTILLADQGYQLSSAGTAEGP
jgi:hypothetical protein